MERIKTESSIIAGVGFDPESNILEIEFHKDGIVKQYLNVNELTYIHLIACSSVGRFYLTYIDGYYEEREVEVSEHGAESMGQRKIVKSKK